MPRPFAVLVSLLAAISVGSGICAGGARAAVSVDVGAPRAVHPVPSGFLGLSLEYYEVGETLGESPDALNPVFDTIVHKIVGDQRPNLRIGGASTDWSYIPTPGFTVPGPVNFRITPTLMSVLAATGRELNARYTLGVNLAADSTRLAGHEGYTLLDAVGRRYVSSEEIGNEPELYTVGKWSRPPLPLQYARSPGYDLGDYIGEFNRMAAVLPKIPTSGPAVSDTLWATGLAAAHSAANRLSTVTIHRYAMLRCGLDPGDPGYPTIARMLAPSTAQDLADNVAPIVRTVHGDGLTMRVDEVNDAPCFGVIGVSNTYASAIWSLQQSFALAATGVDGINFHTEPAAAHRLFNFWQSNGVWHGTVFPMYYGMMMFNWAAPAGSRLLGTTSSASGLSAWATQTSTLKRVTLINTGSGTRTVNLHVPGTHGAASALAMRGPSPSAQSGETLGGVSIVRGTTTGQFTGPLQTTTVKSLSAGHYRVTVPAYSALLLSVAR